MKLNLYILDEADYDKLCSQLEIICADASQAIGCLDDREKVKELLQRIFRISYRLVEELNSDGLPQDTQSAVGQPDVKKITYCDCRDPRDMSPFPLCPKCGGKGYY